MFPTRCPTCNAELFEVIPFETTQREIIEFARHSTIQNKEGIIAGRWMHPGIHCPNGCYMCYVEYRIPLPQITTSEAIAICQQYSQKHHQDFIELHGANSRVVACVHCANFKGATVEGWYDAYRYRNPDHRPLRDHKIVQVSCKATNIQQLEDSWWYNKGESKPECDFFQPGHLFEWVYKDITGWSEYPE